tara:strand:+ start:149 stop:709 length:561 start_codon:yes stop_codon:yes gene_type:complete
MRLVFLGPPGVGKGTQASAICNHFNILHLSTGDILRSEIEDKSHIGLEAKSFMDQGELVPDTILLKIIQNKLNHKSTHNGYLLDGFPRTIPQADGLNQILLELKQALDIVVSLDANEEELVNRLIKRSLDSGRSDDSPDIIKQRQRVYWKQTAPLLEYYKNLNLLKNVNGIGEIEQITKRILKAID